MYVSDDRFDCRHREHREQYPQGCQAVLLSKELWEVKKKLIVNPESKDPTKTAHEKV